MKDKDKTKDELINELAKLGRRIAELETSEIQLKKARDTLRKSEQRLRTILKTADEGFWLINQETVTLDVNPYMCDILGRPKEKIIGHKIYEFVDDENAAIFKKQIQLRDKGKREVYEIALLRPDSSKVFCLFNATPLYDEGIKIGSFAMVTNITRRKQEEEEIRKLSQFQEIIIDNADVWLNVTDKKANITLWNKAAEEISGYSREEVVGHNKVWELLYPDEEYRKKLIAGELRIVSKGGRREGSETTIRCKDGQTKTISWYSRNLTDKDGALIGSLVLGRDITEQKRMEEQLTYMATHDILTGLPNRALFNDRLSMALSHAHRKKQKLAVMMSDLDYFKNINDSLGHKMGDKLLQAVGRRIRGLLRKSDTVARMGGDEFLLLLPEIARVEDAVKVAQKVLEEIREPFGVDKHKLNITTSIGIAIFSDDGKDAGALTSHADIAMYYVKKAGRNSYQRYNPATNTQAQDTRER